MREIKFRAWIPDAEWKKESMFYQEDQYLSSFLRRIYTSYEKNHPSHLNFDIEERLMQYTGLKDKNGVEIYEGDIVINDAGTLGAIEYQSLAYSCSFIIKQLTNTKDWMDDFYDEMGTRCWFNQIEVIGNIYENPELLKDN